MKKPLISLVLLFAALATFGMRPNTIPQEDEYSAYLLVYFKDPTHSLYMALSSDGYTFTDINGGEPVMRGDTLATQRGIRDPHILRAPDGAFYLSMTDLHIFGQQAGYRETQWERDGNVYDWGNNRGFVLMKSYDLVTWTHTNVLLTEEFPEYGEIACAWAPQTVWDDQSGRLMLYFTMRMKGGLTGLYYCYVNSDYDTLETPPQVLFEYPVDGIQILDADITKIGECYHMFYVAQERDKNGVKQAISENITYGYQYQPEWVDRDMAACEGPNLWKRLGTDRWVLMYDVFGIQPHNFGFSETSDFINFTDLGRFNEGVMKATNFSSPKHASVTYLTRQEAVRLIEKWGGDPAEFGL